MILSFLNQGTEDIFNGVKTKSARRICPSRIWTNTGRKLDQIDSAKHLEDLRVPPGNHLKALSGNRKGQHAIRINGQYRICFVWTEQGPAEVEVVDYH